MRRRTATVALAKTNTEIHPYPVVLERTREHDSRANPAKRAIRTLEEQVKVMRLDLEKRTGTDNLAISCLRPWLIRHAGWTRDSEWKQMEPRRFKTRATARAPLSFSCSVKWSCSVPICLTPDARTKTERSTGMTPVGTKAFGADDASLGKGLPVDGLTTAVQTWRLCLVPRCTALSTAPQSHSRTLLDLRPSCDPAQL